MIGKEQNIILGGQTKASHWNLNLISSATKEALPFTASFPNSKGFIVYTINLPSNLQEGGYSIEASSPGQTSSVVAAIHIVNRRFYTITQIPNDLRLLILVLALLLSPLGVIRSRKYRKINFKSVSYGLGEDPLGEDYFEIEPTQLKNFDEFHKKYGKYIVEAGN